ncbi:unnamed protein product [Cochlearia groenlandica]
MKPSVSRYGFKNRSDNIRTNKKKIRCPYGTVPILRNSKEYNTKSQLFAENYFHSLSVNNPGIHTAGIKASGRNFRGVEGLFNANDLKIRNDQATYNQILIANRWQDQINFIHAGFMIKPSHYGDGRVWTYGFWKGRDGGGCYNMACPGFVQVSRYVPIVQPIDIAQGKSSWLHCSVHQDKERGNWWLTHLDVHRADVGYWPKELFNLLDEGGNIVSAGGVVQASHSGSSPPMGNGKFPNGARKDSSTIFTNLGVLDDKYLEQKLDSYPIETVVDSTKCYGLLVGKVKENSGFYFKYGGPGGHSCGV